jgi:Xaa-Pro dipeptidase
VRDAAYLDFPLDEYRSRYERIQATMRVDHLDALLLTTRENVEWASGFSTVSWRLNEKRFWLFVARDRDPVLFVDGVHEANAAMTSWVEDVRIWGVGGVDNIDLLSDSVRELCPPQPVIGTELGAESAIRMTFSEFEAIRRELSDAAFIDADPLLGRVRAIKSGTEIQRIRRACEITEAGYRVGFHAIRAGSTERELVNIIVTEWLRLGAGTPYNANNRGYLSLQAGRVRQMSPTPVDRAIEPGDLIRVDGGAVYLGYCADICRNAIMGEPPPKVQKYAVGTRHVVERTLEAIRPGATSTAIYAASDEATRAIGFELYRRPLTNAVGDAATGYVGHGLGLEIHEYPNIMAGGEAVWVEGMCGAIEVGFGDEETGYVQWEDNFVVTGDGIEVLNHMPKTIWSAG